MTSLGGGDDFVWIGSPDEGSGLLVVVRDEAVEPVPGQDGEAALHGIEPAGQGGSEGQPPMTAQPPATWIASVNRSIGDY